MGQRLLVVDTDRAFLKEHQVSLESTFDLEVAATPEAALARLESGNFAAVLVCAEVSDNKGYSLCSAIRKNPALDGVKLALISGKATEEEYRRHQGLKGRADLYLHKPISPSALTASLTPLVPGRSVDPDNPLGDLADMDLGDDWLEGLKNALDGPVPSASTPVFGVRPAVAHPDESQDHGKVALLEAQLAALQEELRARDQRLLVAEAEAQQVQRQLSSVTLNLDELDRSNREAEALKARLDETESALRSLEDSRGREGENSELIKAQLRESLQERTDLIQQVEALNHQVGEKAQRAIELLRERDRLHAENLDLGSFRGRAQELEAALAGREEALQGLQLELSSLHGELVALRDDLAARGAALAARDEELSTSRATAAADREALAQCQGELAARDEALSQCQGELAARDGALSQCQAELVAREEALILCQEELRARGEAEAARQEELTAGHRDELAAGQRELEAARLAQQQLTTTIEELVDRQASFEAVHQTALLEAAGYKDKAHGLQMEVAGLEATLRGQSRDLAELGVLLQQRDQEALATQALVAEREQQLAAKDGDLQERLDEIARLAAQLAEVRREEEAARLLHDNERLELMNGIDQKDAELAQMNQARFEQQEACQAIEREKQALQGQLAERQDRLQSLQGLLRDIQELVHRGSDLTGI